MREGTDRPGPVKRNRIFEREETRMAKVTKAKAKPAAKAKPKAKAKPAAKAKPKAKAKK